MAPAISQTAMRKLFRTPVASISEILASADVDDPLTTTSARHKQNCAYCGVTAHELNIGLTENAVTLKLCGGCRRIAYCCTDHQKKHWTAGHKRDCKPT